MNGAAPLLDPFSLLQPLSTFFHAKKLFPKYSRACPANGSDWFAALSKSNLIRWALPMLHPAPERGGKIWRKSSDHKNDRPDVATLERVRLKHDLPGLALPQAERELEDEGEGEPA